MDSHVDRQARTSAAFADAFQRCAGLIAFSEAATA
jgi:hypothetical protein